MTQRAPTTTVFVHGFLDDAAVWDRLLGHLAQPTATVTVDLAGMSGRPDADGPYTLARHAAELVELIDRTVGGVLLVGQSLGAQVVELAAARRPDRVVGMVLVAPVPLAGIRLPHDAITPFKQLGGDGEAQRLLRLQLSTDFPADELARLTAAGRSTTPKAVAETVDAWNDGDPTGAEPSAVTAPVLVLRGDQDPFVTADVLAAAVTGRFGQVSTADVPGTGHWPHIERPEVVAALIEDLMTRIGDAADAPTAGQEPATVSSAPAQGWTGAFARRSTDAFDDTLAPDVVLQASVLRAPVEGREAVSRVMAAASGLYTSLRFTHEAKNGDRTYLEWEAALHDGTAVEGVTRLLSDPEGRTVDIAIHHRPLDGALSFSAELGRRLDGCIDRDRFHRP